MKYFLHYDMTMGSGSNVLFLYNVRLSSLLVVLIISIVLLHQNKLFPSFYVQRNVVILLFLSSHFFFLSVDPFVGAKGGNKLSFSAIFLSSFYVFCLHVAFISTVVFDDFLSKCMPQSGMAIPDWEYFYP